jgi:pantetheine-phosphate adenylyltransferase/dephospho-CoA kinase
MPTAIYAFSGDPITYGHIDIIKRAAAVFEKVIVGIGVNPDKKYMFSLEERELMAKQSLQTLKNVEVLPFTGLLVDFAYEHSVTVIVKGVRSASDVEYEQTLHQMGESQKLGIDTFMLFAKPELAHISSSAVKALQKEQGLIHELVPMFVKQYLEEKMSGQYIIGLTGEIGSGKTYVGKKFVDLGKEQGIEVHNIELDEIGHQIQEKLTQPKYQQIRETIIKKFGKKVANKKGLIDRKVLGEIVFEDQQKLAELNEIMYTPILVRLRKELKDKKGLIIFNAALTIEAGMTYLANNNFVVVNADKRTQEERLKARKLSKQQMKRRLKSQYDFLAKKKALKDVIRKDKHGHIWTVINFGPNAEESIQKIFDKIVGEFKLG